MVSISKLTACKLWWSTDIKAKFWIEFNFIGWTALTFHRELNLLMQTVLMAADHSLKEQKAERLNPGCCCIWKKLSATEELWGFWLFSSEFWLYTEISEFFLISSQNSEKNINICTSMYKQSSEQYWQYRPVVSHKALFSVSCCSLLTCSYWVTTVPVTVWHMTLIDAVSQELDVPQLSSRKWELVQNNFGSSVEPASGLR